jgi:chromosome segregation ATPase
MSSRKSAVAQENLERLRQELASRARLNEEADKELATSVQGLASASESIQQLKDLIQLVLATPPNSLRAPEAIERALKTRDHFLGCYEKHHVTLAENERKTFHSAKNTAVDVEQVISIELAGKEWTAQMPEAARRQLSEARRRLTDYQNSLRDFRMDRVVRRTTRHEAGL